MSLNPCLETFGEHFFKYCMDSGYDRVIRVLGGNLLDFLCNLDAMHDHFDSIYPGMRAPSFRCVAESDGGLLLHYYSTRPQLFPVVIGVVRVAAQVLYNVSVDIEQEQELQVGKDHVVLKIRERHTDRCSRAVRQRSCSLAANLSRYKASSRPRDLLLQPQVFNKAFPFHVMFNRKLQIVQAGRAIARVLKHCRKAPSVPLLFDEVFAVIRPAIDLSFISVLKHINTVFAIKTRPGVITGRRLSGDCGATRPDDDNPQTEEEVCMRLKGQMIFVPESDCVLFLCSPRVCNLDDLQHKGLYLSDIPLHDATRDLILITQARRHERELVEKLEETSNNLQKLQSRLREDKRRTDELLHSILPSNVAESLRLNQPVEAEKFDLVTVLFADIVSFTSMCGSEKVAPIDIVRLLNRLYTQFDMLSSLNEVYKVSRHLTVDTEMEAKK